MTHNISALNIAKPFFIQKTSLPVLPNYSSSTSVMHSEAPSSSKPSSSKPSSASENRSKQLAVFYNTYTNPNNTEHALEIIYAQLKVFNQSPLANSTVYYSRFGDLEFKWPINKCRNKGNRQCHEIVAREEGDEVETLQYLYDYCVSNQDHRVVYAHSKGTFTKNWNNRLLSKLLMKAVTSEECTVKMGTNGMKCDTCSTQFSGFPAHYPGNMWVANCDYIAKLIPPRDFEQKKVAVADKVDKAARKLNDNELDDRWQLRLDNGEVMSFHNKSMWMIHRPSWLGIKRYAMEHWLGSHPDMNPCDVFSPKDGVPSIMYDNLKQKRVFADSVTANLQEAPGVTFLQFWTHQYRLHPWYRLKGREYEYKELYSKVPPRSSWFYTYWKGMPLYH